MERLFLAIRPPMETHAALRSAQESIRRQMSHSRLRLTPMEQTHLTIHFLGDASKVDRTALADEIRRQIFQTPFKLRLASAGAFPDTHRPRILWVGTTAAPELLGLYYRLERMLSDLHIDIDRRPFVPHITISSVVTSHDVLKSDLIRVEPVSFVVDRFALLKSMPSAEGSVYETIEEFLLKDMP